MSAGARALLIGDRLLRACSCPPGTQPALQELNLSGASGWPPLWLSALGSGHDLRGGRSSPVSGSALDVELLKVRSFSLSLFLSNPPPPLPQ